MEESTAGGYWSGGEGWSTATCYVVAEESSATGMEEESAASGVSTEETGVLGTAVVSSITIAGAATTASVLEEGVYVGASAAIYCGDGSG